MIKTAGLLPTSCDVMWEDKHLQEYLRVYLLLIAPLIIVMSVKVLHDYTRMVYDAVRQWTSQKPGTQFGTRDIRNNELNFPCSSRIPSLWFKKCWAQRLCWSDSITSQLFSSLPRSNYVLSFRQRWNHWFCMHRWPSRQHTAQAST